MRVIDRNGLVYESVDYSPYLVHHGILGQKWGKQNGPPYPLSGSAHSPSEKKAGWQDSLSKNRVTFGSSEHKQNKSQKPKKDSDRKSALGFAAIMALSIVTLDPVGLAMNTKRLIDYGRAKANGALEKARTQKLVIDKKTGFRLKDHESTPEEDMKHINPEYRNFDKNTKNNCMLCTTAYELRRRGYDVRAGLTTEGYKTTEALKWFPKGKIETAYTSENNKDRVRSAFHLGGKEKYQKLSQLLFKYGNGARGNLMVVWSTTGGGGHSVAWEISGGKLILRDCQSNKVYSSPAKIKKLLSMTFSAQAMRTDNVDFDLEAVKRYLL